MEPFAEDLATHPGIFLATVLDWQELHVDTLQAAWSFSFANVLQGEFDGARCVGAGIHCHSIFAGFPPIGRFFKGASQSLIRQQAKVEASFIAVKRLLQA